jgi:S-DNA-T family DNA segregation ATPase FtsK/SpoIIIE
VGIHGQTILSDFFDSNTCHVLVAGASGSGKSEWLKSLVASLAFLNAPERVRLALVDPKILTFSSVESSPYLWRPLATDIDATLAVLESAVSEMEGRYRILAKKGFVSISDCIKTGRIDLSFIVLVFDEFADLVLTGGAAEDGGSAFDSGKTWDRRASLTRAIRRRVEQVLAPRRARSTGPKVD